MSCAAGDGLTRGLGGPPPYYRQEVGTAVRSISAQEHASPIAAEPGPQLVTQGRQALLGAVTDVRRSTSSIAAPLRQLEANPNGLGVRVNGIFHRYIVYGSNQLPWLHGAPGRSVERLYADMNRVQQLIEPSMRALASLEPAQVEAAATALPELMGQLTQEFHSLREAARVASERGEQFMAAAQAIEIAENMKEYRIPLQFAPWRGR